jgi:hypothetical protein
MIMETGSISEMSVDVYKIIRRNILEDNVSSKLCLDTIENFLQC